MDPEPAAFEAGAVDQLRLFAQLVAHELLAEKRRHEAEAQLRGLQAEIEARRQEEVRHRAQIDVSQVLAGATRLSEAGPRVLQAIGEVLGWDYGSLWVVDTETGQSEVLRSFARWERAPGTLPHFNALTREMEFQPGVGLPGRVWSSRKPLWLHDVVREANFPRLVRATEEGLRTGFAFPILVADQVVGVVEFFSREVRRLEPDLLTSISGLGRQVGQFIERRRAERRLEQSEARKSAVMEAALDAIITIDAEDRVMEWNPAAESIFGISRAAAMGSRLVDLIIPPGYREAHLRGMAHYLATGEGPVLGKRIELSALRQGGHEFPAEVAIAPILVNETPLFTAYLRDVSDRKQMEVALRQQAEELRAANERKDEFLATLAHELRNPLAPIATAIEVLRTRRVADPLVERTQNTIERQTRQLQRLVDDLLDVARVTRGLIELRKEITDLGSVVANAVQTVRPLIEQRDQYLSVSLPMDPVTLEADATRLEQVLTNLLTNASKFTPREGQIWVTAACERQQAVVRVRDTGKGIPAEMLPRIFDIFTQVNPSIDRREGGLGLGLTLVKNLVALHQGSVEAHSEGRDRGSEFVVRLPAVSPALPTIRETAPEATPEAGQGVRVLIVDDNIDAAETLADLLPLWGYEVRCAHTGYTALKAAREYQPRVVLLDIGLPELDGYEVARTLREEWGGEPLTLIALTGFGLETDRLRAREAGFDHHLIKPVRLAELQELLQAAIAS